MDKSEKERLEQYKICKERGHVDSGITLTSNPPWSVCAKCGAKYRYETRLIEYGQPE